MSRGDQVAVNPQNLERLPLTGNLIKALPDNPERLVLDSTVVQALISALAKTMVGREEACRLVVLGLILKEHIFFLGPPGTGKSMLGRELHRLVRSRDATPVKYFDTMFTTFTGPDDVFGPCDIKGLQENVVKRCTEGKLPEARVAFIDEIFKANKGVLNALLTILVDRKYEGAEVPLHTALGASNEIKSESDMKALLDRFLLRGLLDRVQDARSCDGASPFDIPEGFERLLEFDGAVDRNESVCVYEDELLGVSEVLELRRAAMRRDGQRLFGDHVKRFLNHLRMYIDDISELADQSLCSDKRWVKLSRLIQIVALTNGRWEVELIDCFMCTYCLWERKEQLRALLQWMAKALRYYIHHCGPDQEKKRHVTEAKNDIWTNGFRAKFPGSDELVDVGKLIATPLSGTECEAFKKELEQTATRHQEAQARKAEEARAQEEQKLMQEARKKREEMERLTKAERARKAEERRLEQARRAKEWQQQDEEALEKEAQLAELRKRAKDHQKQQRLEKDIQEEQQREQEARFKLMRQRQDEEARAATRDADFSERKEALFATINGMRMHKTLYDMFASTNGKADKEKLRNRITGRQKKIEAFDEQILTEISDIEQADAAHVKALLTTTDLTTGNSLLHIAAKHGLTRTVKKLLGLMVNLEDPVSQVKAKNAFGNTPLHLAAATCEVEIAEKLLDSQADPNARNFRKDSADGEGCTPLDFALHGSRPLFFF